MPFDKITHFVLGLSFVCIVLTLVAISAQADDMPPQPEPVATTEVIETNRVHDLIRKQLSAIKARDADTAWSLATVDFHEKFETGKEFLTHLRLRLRPLYNNENVKFLDQADTQEGIIQRVEIDEHNGEPVTVIYRLEEQDNGELLIDSFAVLEPEAEPI